jgi:hypothetical protein
VSQQVTISLEQAAIRVAMSAVGYRHAGWENHDGGEGNVTFDVQTRSIRVEHRTFIQSYEDDTFTLGLRERKERQELYVSAVDDEDFGDDESETDGPPAVAGA